MKIISAFLIMLMFISCQSLQEKDYFYSETDLVVHNTKIDKDIKLGMTEQDFLTQFADAYDFITTKDDTSYGQTYKTIKTKGIEVSFYNEILTRFTIDENSKDFILPQNIKFQQSEYYIRKIWGQPTDSYGNPKGKDQYEYFYNYYYSMESKIKFKSYQQYQNYSKLQGSHTINLYCVLNDSQRLISLSISSGKLYPKK